MKKIFLAVALLVVCKLSSAQTAAKSIYAELGGPGIASFNYDTRFQKKEDGLGGRIGFGGFAIDGSGVIVVPIGLNYLISKDQKNYLELGAGASIISATGDFTDDGKTFRSSFGHLWMGYRYQPKEGGILFRAGICPIFGNGFFIPYYAGIGFGYKF